VLAIFVKPHLNRDQSYFSSDMCWSLSMYLEAVAMFPQIYMFQKQAGEQNGGVDALIGHTVFALGFSRVFELIFWLGSFKELADSAGSRLPGYVVLLSQFGHLAIMGDFFYYYFQSIRKGKFVLEFRLSANLHNQTGAVPIQQNKKQTFARNSSCLPRPPPTNRALLSLSLSL